MVRFLPVLSVGLWVSLLSAVWSIGAFDPTAREHTDASFRGFSSVANAEPTDLGAQPSAVRGIGDISIILARPLFSPGRLPFLAPPPVMDVPFDEPIGQPVEDDTVILQNLPTEPERLAIVLSGVMVGENRSWALVTHGGNEAEWISIGRRIGQWELIEVSHDSVTFEFGEGQVRHERFELGR